MPDPNTNLENSSFTPTVVEESADVSPPPPLPPATQLQADATTAPPPTPVQEQEVVAPSAPSGRRFPKRIIFVVLAVLLLVLGMFVAVSVILPKLGGRSGQAILEWWGLWEDDSIVASLIAEYEEAHSNVKINYVRQSKQDYRERLTNALASGSGPDIFRIHNTWVPMFVNELDTLPSEVMSREEFSQTFYPVAVSDLTTTAGLVGIPLEYDGLALFINEDIFTTFSKTAPETWDELRQLATELTIKDENGAIKQSGVALGRTENVDHWPDIISLMMLQNGVNLKHPTGERAEQVIKYFTYFASNDIWDETLPPSTSAFAGGKVAMIFGPSWELFEILKANSELNYRIVTVPQLQRLSSVDQGATFATYWVEAVSKRSKSSKEAWEFLKFMASKESLEKFYLSASQTRVFGEPYPRQDLRQSLLTDPNVDGFVRLAPNAKSWYLVSRTYDGETGINTQLANYFEDAINAVNSREARDIPDLLTTVGSGVTQVLSQYGLVPKPPSTTQ